MLFQEYVVSSSLLSLVNIQHCDKIWTFS